MAGEILQLKQAGLNAAASSVLDSEFLAMSNEVVALLRGIKSNRGWLPGQSPDEVA